MAKGKFLSQEIFDIGLENFPMACFDLILQYRGGIILVKRKIPPYKNQWALPGLRMFKGEEIADTLRRIAKQEVGLTVNPKEAHLVSQYVGKFRTEHARQDVSTAYYLIAPDSQGIRLNQEHFSEFRIITNSDTLPKNIGAMYRHHIDLYQKLRRSS